MVRCEHVRGIHRVIQVSRHLECLPVHRRKDDRKYDSCARPWIEHRFEISPADSEICSRQQPDASEETIIGMVTTAFSLLLTLSLKCTSMNLPKRLELLLRVVLARHRLCAWRGSKV